jgi:hypothetical protein
MIDRGGKLSVQRQCELLDLNRTGVYYNAASGAGEGLGAHAADR